METGMAQPTPKTAFALGPVNKRTRKLKRKELLPGLVTCMSITITETSSCEKESYIQFIIRKKCKRTEYILKDSLEQHHVLIKENKTDHGNVQHSLYTSQLRGITECVNQYLSAFTEQCWWLDKDLKFFL